LDITPLARWDWIRWIGATRNPDTRAIRIEKALSKLRRDRVAVLIDHAATMPDTNVRTLARYTAHTRPNAALTTPASNAPAGYPRSRQNRYEPNVVARFAAGETSAAVARSAG
jgi:hypothetical protein